jgi:hypothetical protein
VLEVVKVYPFDAVREQPVKALDKEQKAKHDTKRNVKVIPKDSKREERLRDEEPGSVVQTLDIWN